MALVAESLQRLGVVGFDSEQVVEFDVKIDGSKSLRQVGYRLHDVLVLAYRLILLVYAVQPLNIKKVSTRLIERWWSRLSPTALPRTTLWEAARLLIFLSWGVDGKGTYSEDVVVLLHRPIFISCASQNALDSSYSLFRFDADALPVRLGVTTVDQLAHRGSSLEQAILHDLQTEVHGLDTRMDAPNTHLCKAQRLSALEDVSSELIESLRWDSSAFDHGSALGCQHACRGTQMGVDFASARSAGLRLI